MKTKTKRRIVRLLNSLMIVFSIANLIGVILGFSSKSYAADGFPVGTILGDGTFIAIGMAMGGLPLIIVLVIKLVIVAIGLILQIIISGAFSSLEGSLEWADLSNIIFAGNPKASQFLGINFFDLSTNGTLLAFRTAVAKWYYIIRLICAAILLVILIYVGIRMAISTIASEQAKYKQMLIDWVTSLALLFLLHYIIIFIITINSTLVDTIYNIYEKMGSKNTQDMVIALLGTIFLSGITGLFSAVVYLIFVGQIFSFFLLYIKRMITVGFLIMISPLITITYSIDKIGDGKAQALNAWLKELSYNILIQPFHCIIFVSFFSAIADIITSNPWSIGAYIFAIVIMRFMKKAEDILRKIFHFEASSMSSLSESGQNIANATGKFVGIGMAAGGALANFKAAGGVKAAKENFNEFRNDMQARRAAKREYKEQINKGQINKKMSFADYLQTEQGQNRLSHFRTVNAAEMAAREEAKRQARRQEKIDKNREKYDKKHGDGAYDAMIDKRAQEAYEKKHGAGTYQLLKNIASQTTRKGQPTASAKKAQSQLNQERAKGHNSVIEEGGVGFRRTLKNGWKNTGGRAYKNMRGFASFVADSDYGKLIGAATKDSMKVAAAIGMGAFAMGATGELNDAISLGQTGYGFAKGYLQNSTKTIVKDSSEKTEQLAALIGVDPSDMDEIRKLLASVTAEKNAGALDTKSISNQLDQLRESISSLFSDRKEGREAASLFANEIQAASIKGDLKPAEIERLIEKQFEDLEKDDKDNITMQATQYAQIILKAGIATNGTTLEGAGRDIDEHDSSVAERITKKYSSSNR